MSVSLKHVFGGIVAGSLALSASGYEAKAEPPPKGSEQWNMLAPYRDFVVAMRSPNGRSGCCDLADGRGELDERYENGKLQVFITKKLYPNANIPPEGMWIDVDPASVLTPEKAYEHCKAYVKTSTEHTCHQPPFNVLWLNIGALKPYCYIRTEMTF